MGKDSDITAEDLNKSGINYDALEVYEYIVKRIKHYPEFGGLDRDPEGSDHDGDFSYLRLKDDKVGQFYKHLEAKFYAKLPKKLVDKLVKYAWAQSSKSHAFIPHLMHRTTRQHGLALAQVRGEPYVDELFVVAPWAAGMYSRNRYALSLADATSEELLYIPKALLSYMHKEDWAVKEAEENVSLYESGGRKPNGEKISEPEYKRAQRTLRNAVARPKEAERLWNIINLFRKTVWGEIPEWVHYLREKMVIVQYDYDPDDPKKYRADADGNPIPKVIRHDGTVEFRKLAPGEIDLNDSLLPMPGELLINILRVDQEKEALLARRKIKKRLEKPEEKLRDKAHEYAEDLLNVQTRIGDIDTEIAGLNPATDAARISDLTNEKNDLTLQLTELERIYDLISEKLDLIRRELRSAGVENVEADIEKFVLTYSKLGYGDSLDVIGRFNLEHGGYKPDDYITLAFARLQDMYEEFRAPASEPLSIQDIKDKIVHFSQDIIGKAKLIPGKHHLIFGPFTMRYIHRLLNQFEGRHDQREVWHVVEEVILKNIGGADGLPWYAEDYVRNYLEAHTRRERERKLRTLLRADIIDEEKRYRGELWRFHNEHPVSWEKQVATSLPWDVGKRDEHGEKMRTVAPWNWDKISESTTEDKSKASGH